MSTSSSSSPLAIIYADTCNLSFTNIKTIIPIATKNRKTK